MTNHKQAPTFWQAIKAWVATGCLMPGDSMKGSSDDMDSAGTHYEKVLCDTCQLATHVPEGTLPLCTFSGCPGAAKLGEKMRREQRRRVITHPISLPIEHNNVKLMLPEGSEILCVEDFQNHLSDPYRFLRMIVLQPKFPSGMKLVEHKIIFLHVGEVLAGQKVRFLSTLTTTIGQFFIFQEIP